MYYIVKSAFLRFLLRYPMVILWLCYGYPMERIRDDPWFDGGGVLRWR